MKMYLLMLSLGVVCLHAQTSLTQAFTSLGGTLNGGAITVDYAIGEVVTQSSADISANVVSGILQPKNQSVLSVVEEAYKNALVVYPNPTQGLIHLSSLQAHNASLYSLNGDKLEVFMALDQTIDISHLQSGLYILKIYNNNSELISLNKISKY